jgi:hypothetical protein
MSPGFVRHIKGDGAPAGQLLVAGRFGVKVVFTRRAAKNLTFRGKAEALGIGFVGFHIGLFLALHDDGQTFGTRFGRLGHPVGNSHKFKEAVQTGGQEFFVHILGAAGQEQFYLNPVALA